MDVGPIDEDLQEAGARYMESLPASMTRYERSIAAVSFVKGWVYKRDGYQ